MPQKAPIFHTLLLLALLSLLGPTAHAAVDGSLKWAYTTLSSTTAGAIVSSPAAGPDGTIYVGVEIGSSSSLISAGRLYAFTPDGTFKWFFAPDAVNTDWIDSTPAIAPDGSIVFGSWNGRVYCLNPDGTNKWTPYNTDGYIAGSAAIGPDGTIYIGSGSSFLFALNPNGTLKWRYPTSDWIDSSPALAPDGTVYFGCWDNYVYALNPDGTLKWRYLTGSDITGSPSLAADGTVYIGSRDKKLYALNPDGTLRWSFTCGDTIDGSASLDRDGTVVFGSADGRVYALRPDGSEKWRYPAAGSPALQSLYSSPAIRDDGSVVIGTSDNKILCLNSDGTQRWATPVGDWVDSSPLVTADGSIYVGSQDKVLYCLNGTQGPIATDWGQYRRDPMRSAWQPIGVATNNSGRISNMSVRASFSAGQNISVGTWLNGTGSRTLLARAVGPTLEGFGVTGFMPDPAFAVYNQGAFVSENDNWELAPNLAALNTATAANTGFALGAGKADAAVLQDFTAGGYTLEVSGKNGSSGVCLVELYDTGGASTARISNISARTLVGTGEKVLVPGFYLSGGARTLLIRGIGPSLAPFFSAEYLLANPLLAAPRLRIYSGTRLIAESLAWSTVSNAAQLRTLSASVFAFPLLDNSLDASILITLPAGGPYTATLDGVGGLTGQGMVEVYELP